MVKRFVDEGYFKYTAYNAQKEGLEVVCPDCGARAVVTADKDTAYLRCTKCALRKQQSLQAHVYRVEVLCSNCHRPYRVEVAKDNSSFKKLNVRCPHCDTLNQGEIHKSPDRYCYAISSEVVGGREPYFGLKLWYQISYQGKLIWAVNREHLIYMIDYLSAQLREKCPGPAMRSQSDRLPAFIRSAKNRDRIVQLLKRLHDQ